MSFINPNQNISWFDQIFLEDDAIRGVRNLNNTISYTPNNYKGGNTLFNIIEDPFLERGSIREDFPDLNLSGIKEDEEIDDSMLTVTLDNDRGSNKFYHDISPEDVHSQIGTAFWTNDQEGIIKPEMEFKEGQMHEEFSLELLLFQSDKGILSKDLLLGSKNSSFDWSRSNKTVITQNKLKPKKAVSKARDTTVGTLSTTKDSGNNVPNPLFNDQSWLGLDPGVQPNSTSNLLDITGTTQTEDKNPHKTFLSDKTVEQQQHQQSPQQADNSTASRRDMTIEPKNFRFVVKACEKIVDSAFGVNKEENRKDPRDTVKALNDYLRDYEKLVRENQKVSSGKGDPLVQGGKEIYDEVIKMKQNMSEQELLRRAMNCRIEMPLPMIELQAKEVLKSRGIETTDILKHSERKKQYTTFKSFEDCGSEEETFRRWMITCVARKWMITQDMPLEMQNMQGNHGSFILAVLQGDLSVDNKIRMLDFKCKGTRHINGMLAKVEKNLRKKLEKLNSDWIMALDGIANLMGLNSNGDFFSTLSSKESSVTQDTRSQTVPSPNESENELREEPTKKGKESLSAVLQRKFMEICRIVTDIETRQGAIKEELKNELTLAKGFINKNLVYKEKEVDNLILMAEMCLQMLVNGLRRYQISQFYIQRYGGQTNLEKRSFENLQEVPEAHMSEREGIKRIKQ